MLTQEVFADSSIKTEGELPLNNNIVVNCLNCDKNKSINNIANNEISLNKIDAVVKLPESFCKNSCGNSKNRN